MARQPNYNLARMYSVASLQWVSVFPGYEINVICCLSHILSLYQIKTIHDFKVTTQPRTVSDTSESWLKGG